MRPALPEPSETVAVVRPRKGTVGESKRVCHLVPVPANGTSPQRLRSYCGVSFRPGEAELLGSIRGMPCEICLARSAPSHGAGLLPATS